MHGGIEARHVRTEVDEPQRIGVVEGPRAEVRDGPNDESEGKPWISISIDHVGR